jgi:hypothetical protein
MQWLLGAGRVGYTVRVAAASDGLRGVCEAAAPHAVRLPGAMLSTSAAALRALLGECAPTLAAAQRRSRSSYDARTALRRAPLAATIIDAMCNPTTAPWDTTTLQHTRAHPR